MKYKFFLLTLIILFISSCYATLSNRENFKYTVKVINSSNDKVLLRFEDDENSYKIRIIDENSSLKFKMNGELVIQYIISNYEDFKILSIKQHTFIHVLKDNIIIDDLPKEDIIKN
jgi:hypothetical protein